MRLRLSTVMGGSISRKPAFYTTDGPLLQAGQNHLNWLRQYGNFENNVPVHDSIAQ